LLATKLHMPRAAAPVIDRPHLRQRLQRGLERPLTILTAPAGFGKTTALRAWLQHDRVRAGWLSLDRDDNDPAQFWAYTLAALDSAHPGVAEAALAMLRAPTPPPL